MLNLVTSNPILINVTFPAGSGEMTPIFSFCSFLIFQLNRKWAQSSRRHIRPAFIMSDFRPYALALFIACQCGLDEWTVVKKMKICDFVSFIVLDPRRSFQGFLKMFCIGQRSCACCCVAMSSVSLLIMSSSEVLLKNYRLKCDARPGHSNLSVARTLKQREA